MSRARTAAELQIEMLRQLKAATPPKRPTAARPPAMTPVVMQTPVSRPLVEASLSGGPKFELAEAPRPKAKPKGPSLPLGRETWTRLKARQADGHEFASRKAMAEWAAELLLALPVGSSRMDAEAKAELFKRLREWAEARGLK